MQERCFIHGLLPCDCRKTKPKMWKKISYDTILHNDFLHDVAVHITGDFITKTEHEIWTDRVLALLNKEG